MASIGRIESKTGCPPSGSLYDPTTHPPAFAIASAASAAVPVGCSSRHSAGPRPFVPGLALRGRRRAGARLTIAENSTPLSASMSSVSDRASAAPGNNDGLAAQLWITTLLDGGVIGVHIYVDDFPDHELAKCSIKLDYRKAGM